MEKKALLTKMDRLFRMSPSKHKAKDGSGEMITLEHRIGRDAGYFTTKDLMKKLGLEDEYADYVLDMQKKIRDEERCREVLADKYKLLKSKVGRVVSDYRDYLEKFFGNYPRPLLPMFAFVAVGDRDDGLYIQGLLDQTTLKLVIGEPEDDVLWCEKVFTKTKPSADLNARAEATAKALTSHPGLNKDLRFRVGLIAQGKLPEKLTYNGGEPEKK